jgi:hypothetical protein
MIVKIEKKLAKIKILNFAFRWKLKWVRKRWMKVKMFGILFGHPRVIVKNEIDISYWFKAFFHVK